MTNNLLIIDKQEFIEIITQIIQPLREQIDDFTKANDDDVTNDVKVVMKILDYNSANTVYKLSREGVIPAVKKTRWYWSKRDLREWVSKKELGKL